MQITSKWGCKDTPNQSLNNFPTSVKSLFLKHGTDIDTDKPSDLGLELPLAFRTKATGLDSSSIPLGEGLTPPENYNGIIPRAPRNRQIIDRCTKFRINGSSLNVPQSYEASRASNTSGVTSSWLDAGETGTASSATVGKSKLKPHRLAIYLYMTDELYEDTLALEDAITQLMVDELFFQINKSLIRGNGVNKPLGVMNAPCTITTSSVGGTVAVANLAELFKDFHEAGYQSPSSTILSSSSTGYSLVEQPSIFRGFDSGTNRIMGIPLIFSEHVSDGSALGQILIADWSQYALGFRTDEAERAISSHVAFVAGESVLRLTWRVDGQPLWPNAVTPATGSVSKSPFVICAA